MSDSARDTAWTILQHAKQLKSAAADGFGLDRLAFLIDQVIQEASNIVVKNGGPPDNVTRFPSRPKP